MKERGKKKKGDLAKQIKKKAMSGCLTCFSI